MITKTAVALAIIATTVTGSLAATKNRHGPNGGWNVYDTRGHYLGTDPDPFIRNSIARDPHEGVDG